MIVELIAILMLWQAWGVASSMPTTERISVSVTGFDGSRTDGEFIAFFDPNQSPSQDPNQDKNQLKLHLAVGPLLIEADQRGVWAAHRNDPTTIARLTTDPFIDLAQLETLLPPTTLPSASLGVASSQERWSPSPLTGPVRWTRASLITEGPLRLPIGMRLKGHSSRTQVTAEFRHARLRALTLRSSQEAPQQTGNAQIDIVVEPLDEYPYAPIERNAVEVRRLGLLAPLGLPLGVGSRLPADLDFFSPLGAVEFETMPWDPAATFRVVVLVRHGDFDERASLLVSLQSSIVAAQDRLARHAADTRRSVVQFTPLLVHDGPGIEDPRARAQALRERTGNQSVLTMVENRRLIERLSPGAIAIGVVVDRQRVIRGVIPWSADERAFTNALVDRLLSESARSR